MLSLKLLLIINAINVFDGTINIYSWHWQTYNCINHILILVSASIAKRQILNEGNCRILRTPRNGQVVLSANQTHRLQVNDAVPNFSSVQFTCNDHYYIIGKQTNLCDVCVREWWMDKYGAKLSTQMRYECYFKLFACYTLLHQVEWWKCGFSTMRCVRFGGTRHWGEDRLSEGLSIDIVNRSDHCVPGRWRLESLDLAMYANMWWGRTGRHTVHHWRRIDQQHQSAMARCYI